MRTGYLEKKSQPGFEFAGSNQTGDLFQGKNASGSGVIPHARLAPEKSGAHLVRRRSGKSRNVSARQREQL